MPPQGGLSETARSLQDQLRLAVKQDGGRLGIPPEISGQISPDLLDMDALTDYADQWARKFAEPYENDSRYFSGRPGFWRCFDELYPLQDPNRWNAIRHGVTTALERRGWVRPGGPQSSAWIIPGRLRLPSNTNGFLLTYNESRWQWLNADRLAAIAATSAGRLVTGRWSTGNRTGGIRRGDGAYLLRQGHDRGLIASGRFASEVYQDADWDEERSEANYADVDWDIILDTPDRLPVEELKAVFESISWDRLQGSGIVVPREELDLLAATWVAHVDASSYTSPEEVDDPDQFVEGAVTTVTSNRYERDRRARAKCIEHWGLACAVCGFDFEQRYGEIGTDFIHVHHLRELSSVGESYVVHAVDDLRPVCPNCHAMLHRVRPALSIATLRKRLRTKSR